MARAAAIAGAFALLTGGWLTLWTVRSFWNPLAFTALWIGAALLMWRFSRRGYPGFTKHAGLSLLSVPLWWWFEATNSRVGSWEYIVDFEYTTIEYAVLSSLAFSTVVPALSAATSLIGRPQPSASRPVAPCPAALGLQLILAGLAVQVVVLVFPAQFFPLVWIAPLLVFDGLAARSGGGSLLRDVAAGRWGEAATIASAGLVCGLLWEYWNFWASPMWIYHVPGLGFGKLFEMPIPGYAGYIPFAWSVARLVCWTERLRWSPRRKRLSQGRRASRPVETPRPGI